MSKQMIKKISRGHSGCCNAPNHGPSTLLRQFIAIKRTLVTCTTAADCNVRIAAALSS